MRSLAAAGLLFLCVAGGGGGVAAKSATASAADRAAIAQVITAQIEAFRHDDGAGALQFAAPGLQRQFGDGAHFLDIVRRGYPAVFRPQSFSFNTLASAHGVTLQKVDIVGPGGQPVTAIYDMEHEPDGSWRIAGCSVVKSDLIAL